MYGLSQHGKETPDQKAPYQSPHSTIKKLVHYLLKFVIVQSEPIALFKDEHKYGKSLAPVRCNNSTF
jgi:hypothetical protein